MEDSFQSCGPVDEDDLFRWSGTMMGPEGIKGGCDREGEEARRGGG